jgi:hypothetical protein
MPAPKGNKYNEIWDLDNAESFCDSVLKYTQDNKNCRSLSEACVELGQYEELISYLSNKFDKDFKSIKRAKDIVKNRLVSQGLDGDANPTMAIFILKNNHNMTDRQQTDITTNGKDVSTTPIIKFVEPEDGD